MVGCPFPVFSWGWSDWRTRWEGGPIALVWNIKPSRPSPLSRQEAMKKRPGFKAMAINSEDDGGVGDVMKSSLSVTAGGSLQVHPPAILRPR